MMSQRFPKRGFRSRRFNTDEFLETINLGKIAYFIEKGTLDASKEITMKTLFDTGIVNKIQHGVKLLGQGSERFKALGVTVNMEVSDATQGAIEAIRESGGKIRMDYRTPLIMR